MTTAKGTSTGTTKGTGTDTGMSTDTGTSAGTGMDMPAGGSPGVGYGLKCVICSLRTPMTRPIPWTTRWRRAARASAR
ncbi:hypothetical protein GCM10023259_053510 [Thermocatellispora tengchongensis]